MAKAIVSQHTTQQARGIREEKSVVTKKFPIATEIAKDSKKSYSEKSKLCRDIVDRLKR